MSSSFSFRIRVDRSPTDTIEVSDSELVLVEGAQTRRVSLKGQTAGQSLNEAQHFVLLGTGYSTEEEARSAGEFYETTFMLALARVRVGADFGDRSAKGLFTTEGLIWLEEQHGQRVLNNVHGLMVFPSEPKPQLANFNAGLLRSASKDSFTQAFAAAKIAKPAMNARERLAFSLFNASFFQPTTDSRFLLLVMAIEALIVPSARSPESTAHVNTLISATKKAEIPNEERESMLGAIRWLQKESIGQAGRRIVDARLGARQYDGRTASNFFTYAYQTRSNLVHGNIPYPTFETVGAISATLEVFVSELLTIPLMGLPKQST